MTLPNFVEITEVGPRDGLQSQSAILSTEQKVRWISSLVEAGIERIEVGAFVSSKAVPAMADSFKVICQLPQSKDLRYMALVPNEKGLDKALEAKLSEIAVFTSLSETFCQKNINTSIQGSYDRFETVISRAKKENIFVRAYISCVFSCPYEGDIRTETLIPVAERLFEMGCDEISLGDTLGTATVEQTRLVYSEVEKRYDTNKVVAHFHDSYGGALDNIALLLEIGFFKFDSSAGGIGGCPYAPGASGNVATEDLLTYLDQLGISTGIHKEKLQKSTLILNNYLNKSS